MKTVSGHVSLYGSCWKISQSKKMIQGAHTGQYNSRGVTTRGDGGTQERVLAEKYRRWANELQYSHPFVASQLLMALPNINEHAAHREDAEAGIDDG